MRLVFLLFFCGIWIIFFLCFIWLQLQNMSYQWMQSFKAENQRKTVLLLILFPALLFVIFWVIISLFFTNSTWTENMFNEWLSITLGIFPIVLIVLWIRWIVSFVLQKDLMFGLSWAKAITRKENPEIYNIVENLCISKWLPMPKIAIMEEAWMNAFATWWKQEDSWVAFTTGLLQNLNKNEIEAVAWHELTHLINRDSLLMYVAYVFVGAVSLVWQVILRTGNSSSSSKKSSWIVFFWLAFLVLWYLLYPLVKLAISRKREYMADLWSVEITKDNQSMISALRKISNNSYVSKANNGISWFFIANPKSYLNNYSVLNQATENTKKIKTSIRDSHPSIDDRISRLQQY